jgi:predicted DNA-binding protein
MPNYNPKPHPRKKGTVLYTRKVAGRKNTRIVVPIPVRLSEKLMEMAHARKMRKADLISEILQKHVEALPLPIELHERLDSLAQRQGKQLAEVAVAALKLGLNLLERSVR